MIPAPKDYRAKVEALKLKPEYKKPIAIKTTPTNIPGLHRVDLDDLLR